MFFDNQTVLTFKLHTYAKLMTWLRKGNLNRETESLQIAAQNNAVRTNHIRATRDKNR